MDEKVWNPTLVEVNMSLQPWYFISVAPCHTTFVCELILLYLFQLMIKIGNDKANQLLEHKLPEDDKISPEANVYV